MATYSYILLTSKINKRRSLLHLIMLYNKKKTINCNYRRISFHNKEARTNKHIDIAYLNKPAHCYIEAANLRSNNIYGS